MKAAPAAVGEGGARACLGPHGWFGRLLCGSAGVEEDDLGAWGRSTLFSVSFQLCFRLIVGP
nr:unnamed protein product [Digitaria exilis]